MPFFHPQMIATKKKTMKLSLKIGSNLEVLKFTNLDLHKELILFLQMDVFLWVLVFNFFNFEKFFEVVL